MKNTLPSHLGGFILSTSKRIMNNFTGEINGHYNHAIHYGDRDSIIIENKYWNMLDKASIVGSNLCQRRGDLKMASFSMDFS